MELHWPSKYTWRVVGVTFIMSLCAGLFGFDTGSIGAITTMSQFQEVFGELKPLIRGVVVSIILVPSGVTGVLAGNVSEYLSRKRTISLGAAIFAAGSAISAASKTSLGVLIFGRCVAGTGEGLFLGILGVYLCEISPQHLRPQMLLFQQVICTAGVALGFFFCYGSARVQDSMAWRAPFVMQTITATIVAIAAPFMPYSARWLLSKGRREEAERVLDLLVGPDNIDERRELMSTGPAAGKMSQLAAMKALWEPGVRGRTLLGIAVNVFQQLSGIDFVLFYAPLLFEQAGLDPSTSSFIASGVTGLILVACSVAGTFYINRVGRRKIWLFGGTAVAFCHIVLGILYASGAAQSPVGQYAAIVFIELFAVSFTSSWANVTKLYAAEIQPSRTRGAAASLGQGMNQLVNFGVAVSGPFFLDKSSFGPYFLYGGFSALGVVFGYFFMYEVLGKSLEGIDQAFEGSAVAVSLPKILRGANLTDIRQRKNSRSQSATLPGETREDIRRHVMELQAIGENSVIEEDDEDEPVRPAGLSAGKPANRRPSGSREE
ncbi:hypothetical protein JCM8547_001820 [Rhodosporidiobolus lusitaniae]